MRRLVFRSGNPMARLAALTTIKRIEAEQRRRRMLAAAQVGYGRGRIHTRADKHAKHLRSMGTRMGAR